MSYYPKVRGDKCFLSPIDLNDAPTYTAWLNDLEVARTLGQAEKMISEEMEKGVLKDLAKEHIYGIVTNETDHLIGNCSVMDLDYKNQTAEVGILIGDKAFWGKGFGTEALILLCGYAFDYLNMKNLMLRVFDFNLRALKCYEKVGFKEMGRRRKSIRMEGQQFDVIYMDLLEEEFRASLS